MEEKRNSYIRISFSPLYEKTSSYLNLVETLQNDFDIIEKGNYEFGNYYDKNRRFHILVKKKINMNNNIGLIISENPISRSYINILRKNNFRIKYLIYLSKPKFYFKIISARIDFIKKNSLLSIF